MSVPVLTWRFWLRQVNVEDYWTPGTPIFPTRYISSAYYVLNALENGARPTANGAGAFLSRPFVRKRDALPLWKWTGALLCRGPSFRNVFETAVETARR